MEILKPIKVLISLYRGYGLGDSVQMSAVLKHLRKYRPHWSIDYQAEAGQHEVGNGIVNSTFNYVQPLPDIHYDAEVQIRLYDTWANWSDRPNTRVSSCLHECFGIKWDSSCGRYQVNVGKTEQEAARLYIQHKRAVAFHYEGDCLQNKKNLTYVQAKAICTIIKDLGWGPLLLDYRSRSILKGLHTTRSLGSEWGGNVTKQCAIISQCKAFIGIDSGPGKCASATNTPSLIIWTKLHPSAFHDPAPNTTHLVPENYHSLHPVCNDSGVVKWFDQNYNVITYKDDLVKEVKSWLIKTLK